MRLSNVYAIVFPTMPARAVLQCPDPLLRVASTAVVLEAGVPEDIRTLIEDLKLTMREERGIGIAAPQIGVHHRVIIVDMGRDGVQGFINPEIIEQSFKMIDSEEGCLSVPGQWGVVQRHRAVTVRVIGEDGAPRTIKATNLLSTVFQHEIDHLNGVLFIDRMS